MKLIKVVQNALLVFALLLSSVLTPAVVLAAGGDDGAVIYVKSDGNDGNDGTMISEPKATLAAAFAAAAAAAATAPDNKATVMLLDDIVVGANQPLDMDANTITITSDAQGPHSIIREAGYKGRMITVYSADENGHVIFDNVIIDGNDVEISDAYSTILVSSGIATFTNTELKNHFLSGNTSAAVVFTSSRYGTTIIETGTYVHDNTVGGSGSVLGAGTTGHLMMKAGLVTGNTVTESAVVILIGQNNWPQFSMTGGSIKNNSVATVAIAKLRGDSTLAFGGTAYVYDNLDADGNQRNVKLDNTAHTGSAFLTLIEEMKAGAKVGVFANLMPDEDHPIVDIAFGGESYVAAATDADYFEADKNTSAIVAYNDEGADPKVVLQYQAPVDLAVDEPTDGRVVSGRPAASGTGTDGATVTARLIRASDSAVVFEQDVVIAGGEWSIPAGAAGGLAPGDYTLEVTATDGKVTSEKIVRNLTVAAGFAIAEPADGAVVDVRKPQISGTAEAGSTVTVAVYGGTESSGLELLPEVGGTADIDVNGEWTFTPQEDLPDGEYTVYVTAQKGGHAETKAITFTVGTPTPTGKLDSLVLTDSRADEIVLTPLFDPDRTDGYTAAVPYATSSIAIDPASAESGTSRKVMLNGEEIGPADWDSLPLKVGKNIIKVETYDDHTGELLRTYTIEITRHSASSDDSGGGGGAPAPLEEDTAGIVVTVDSEDDAFATGAISESDGRQVTSVTVDSDKLDAALAQGRELAIHSPHEGDMEIDGLTVEDIEALAGASASLTISNPLAIYPVPGSELDVSGIAAGLGNAAPGEIDVHIEIARASDGLIANARSKAEAEGYELLVDPVTLDMTFSHNGQTVRADRLNGYAPRYIALPEGIDPNRITTGVIVYPDGSVYHVPTVVTRIDNRYYALINDLRGNGSYSVIWNPQDFADVRGHWGQTDVNNIAARLDLQGTGDNNFSPNRDITRSEFAQIVVLGLGLMGLNIPDAEFPDVPDAAWYNRSVAIASEFGIVSGYDDGMFRGDQDITREQGIAMIARAYRLINPQSALDAAQIGALLADYRDASDVSPWARADAALMIQSGILQGRGQLLLNPQANITRAEVAALLARLLKTTGLIDK